MARRTHELTIESDDRDNGKTFLLTEMPADQGEKWAMRAFLALTNAGAELPPGFNMFTAGMAGFAMAGVQSLLRLQFGTIEPLADEMFESVQYVPPNREIKPTKILRGQASQIEEVKTRLKLRDAWIELHTGFSVAAVARNTAAAAAAATPAPPITPTSPIS
jgi:hypothetical protein